MASPFKKAPEKNFSELRDTDANTFVFTSTEEQSKTIEEKIGAEGGGINFALSASVDYSTSSSTSKTKLIETFSAKQVVGTWEYELENLQLQKEAKNLLDASNKTADQYKKQLERFVSQYGYYFVNSYQIYAAVNAKWIIQTKSESTKSELATKLKGSATKPGNSLSVTNDLTYKVASSYEDEEIDFVISQIGLKKTALNPEQADEIIANWDQYVNKDSGAIGKVNISTWNKIPAIGKLLNAVPTTEEFEKALKVLEAANISQVLWNEISIFLAQLSLLKTSIDATIDKPYSNGYWGFMMKESFLPIDSLKKIQKKIDDVFYTVHQKLDEKNILSIWIAEKDDWKKSLSDLKDIYKKMTTIPKLHFDGILTEADEHHPGSSSAPPKPIGERQHFFKDFQWGFDKFTGGDTKFFEVLNDRQHIFRRSFILYVSVECTVWGKTRKGVEGPDKFFIQVHLRTVQALSPSSHFNFYIDSDQILLQGDKANKAICFQARQTVGWSQTVYYGVWWNKVTIDKPYVPELEKVDSLKMLLKAK